MERLVCLVLICVASALAQTAVDPRGARPVEPGTRSDKCDTKKEWPFCTDDDWGNKCPSGCRIQGLMDKFDHSAQKNIQKIRSLLDQNRAKHRNADQATKQTYDFLKDKLQIDAGNDNSYFDLAQNLRQRITDMKIKIDRQLRILAALKDRVKDQVVEMERLEVDIDIKLRSCKGSCATYSDFQVDKESYVSLEKQIGQLDNQTPRESTGTLYVMKSRPLQQVLVDSVYKSKDVAGQQRENIFPDVNTVSLVLEQEGSSSSPATISKVPVCMKLKQQNQSVQQPLARRRSYRRPQCRAKADVPMCYDDDWVSKCPSGCRLQGLISKMESEVEKKLRKVCKTGLMYEEAAERSMKAMTHIYSHNRRVIVNRYMSDLKFVEHAERLAGNLTLLRDRSSTLSQQLEEMNHRVQRQIQDLYRAEVDIDMKLRTCQGSCHSATPFDVSHPSYEALQNDMAQLDKTLQYKSAAMPPKDIPHVKLQPVDIGLMSSSEYKMIPTVQRELLTQFEDIGQNRVVLDQLQEESESVDSDIIF